MLSVSEIKSLEAKAVETEDTLLLASLREGRSKDGKHKSTFSHRRCMSNYISNELSASDIIKLFGRPIMQDLIAKEYGLAVSNIKDLILEKYPGVPIYNSKIKGFIQNEFGNLVDFCKPFRSNQSEVVYPVSVSQSVIIARLQALDELASAGRTLRDVLQKFSFSLEDTFCDSFDLESALMNTRIPDCAVTFISSLLNIKKAEFSYMQDASCHEPNQFDDNNDDDGEGNQRRRRQFSPKILKAHAIFQTMFYAINNRHKKAPLQVSLAHTIYERCKGKELIRSTNSLAFTISYSELRKLRNNLGAKVVHLNENQHVLLPLQFNTDDFCIAAMDNMDHTDMASLSGDKSNRDSYMVLFQNRNEKVAHDDYMSTVKPSDLHGSAKGRRYMKELPCQTLKSFHLATKKQELPSSFLSNEFHYEVGIGEKIISLLRTNEVMTREVFLSTWAGIHSLVSTSNSTLKKVGFLPLIPHPITKIETVFTCLRSLKSIAERLSQPVLPIACDGVYSLVVQIWLQQPEMFNNIYPMLGTFHMTKSALKCAGKYIRGSGAEDAFIETQIFGPKTLESVLNGGHYYRSFCGLSMLDEAIAKLKMEAFWEKHCHENFQAALNKLSSLKNSVSCKKPSSSQKLMEQFQVDEDVIALLSAIKLFDEQCNENSEQCKFWNNFRYIVGVIKNLVLADRGDFLLSVKSIQDLCPIFHGADAIHYLRYGSFYLKTLKSLKYDHLELHAAFMKGDFVIKTSKGPFNAVAVDMKLEQTIQRSAKSVGGIIGRSKAVDYVTEWSIIYHDVVNNLPRRSWYHELV